MSDQGQSLSTIDKERQIGAMFAMNLQIVRQACPGEKYFHLDLNAGSGWNWRFQVPGSPVVFVEAAERILGHRWEAWFYEIDSGRATELEARLRGVPGCHVLAEDNCGFLKATARFPRNALGSVLVDPNGWLYRKRNGDGCPVPEMAQFFAEHRRIDFLANLNRRTYRMMAGARNKGLATYRDFHSESEFLKLFSKRYGLITKGSSNGHSEFMRVILRNVRTNDYRAWGWNLIQPDPDPRPPAKSQLELGYESN